MTINQQKHLHAIQEICQKITSLHNIFEQLIIRYRDAVTSAENSEPTNPNLRSGKFWRVAAYHDSLIRLRLLLEQNFQYIESMGLLAVTRYIFELIVWLKILKKDARYGYVYYYELLDKQRHYWSDLREQLKREIGFLEEFEKHEKNLRYERLNKCGKVVSEDSAKMLDAIRGDIELEVDRAAARKFSLYADQARVNGYGFQAHLVQSKALPVVNNSVTTIEQEISRFKNNVPKDIKSLLSIKWKWKDQATLVGMKEEFEFIYSYTSRLLHATPASLTTDQKNLEAQEMMVFLKYIQISLIDIIEMAEQLLQKE